MDSNLKIVILCGGRGTRLKEETEVCPKPMVEIGGRPILWHIMKIYSHYGFKDFILCLGYKGEMIKNYFYHYHIARSDFTIDIGTRDIQIHEYRGEENWKITMVDTGIETLKGGRIKRIERYINEENFMLTYGDGVSDINIRALVNFHLSHGKIGTVTGVRPPSRFGEVKVEGERVVKFTEKPQVSEGLINGGFFVFSKKIFGYLSEDKNCDFEYGTLEKLAEEKQLMIYKFSGNWECMDNIRDLKHLNKLWAQNQAFWKTWDK